MNCQVLSSKNFATWLFSSSYTKIRISFRYASSATFERCRFLLSANVNTIITAEPAVQRLRKQPTRRAAHRGRISKKTPKHALIKPVSMVLLDGCVGEMPHLRQNYWNEQMIGDRKVKLHNSAELTAHYKLVDRIKERQTIPINDPFSVPALDSHVMTTTGRNSVLPKIQKEARWYMPLYGICAQEYS